MLKCENCPRMLYKYDQVIVNNKSYHKTCFTCTNTTCKKILHADSFVEVNNRPYCSDCQTVASELEASQDKKPLTAAEAKEQIQRAEASTPSKAAILVAPSNRRIGGVAAALLKKHAEQVDNLTPAVAAAITHAIGNNDSAPMAPPQSTPCKAIPPTPAPTPIKSDFFKPTPTKFAVSAPKCACCNTSVYKAEEVHAMNQYWHKSCFKCGAKGVAGGCKKVLSLDSYKEHHSEPFCKTCFVKVTKEETQSLLLKKGTNGQEKSASDKSNTTETSVVESSLQKLCVDTDQHSEISDTESTVQHSINKSDERQSLAEIPENDNEKTSTAEHIDEDGEKKDILTDVTELPQTEQQSDAISSHDVLSADVETVMTPTADSHVASNIIDSYEQTDSEKIDDEDEFSSTPVAAAAVVEEISLKDMMKTQQSTPDEDLDGENVSPNTAREESKKHFEKQQQQHVYEDEDDDVSIVEEDTC